MRNSREGSEEVQKTQGAKIGFLCCCQRAANGGYIGGLLVTSESGLPIEFRCSSPVMPTAAQKILYGALLEPYIEGELLGGTLLKETSEKPSVILTDKESVLNLRPQIQTPLAWIRRHDGTLEIPTGPDSSTPNAILKSAFDRYRPAVVTVHHEHNEEVAHVQSLLVHAVTSMDLVEPFERVHEALVEIEKQRK